MTHSVAVLPWPIYSDTGREITWEVRVDAPKFHGTLRWYGAARRFHKDNHMFRLRRGSPKLYREAVQTMVEFSALSVTLNAQPVTDAVVNVTDDAVTSSCARGGYALGHGCHSDNKPCDCDCSCDSDSLRRDRSATRQGRTWT